MKNIVTQEWLNTHLSRSELIVCDCRFNLSKSAEGRRLYEEGHIPGAIYVDLEQDLSKKKEKHGGRHPLPETTEIANNFGKLGITEKSTVVAYDDQGGSMAARLWWMLKRLGNENVFVLQGGYSKWVDLGYPVSTERPEIKEAVFLPQTSRYQAVEMNEVKRMIEERPQDAILIDSRDPQRYSGEHEPIDKEAGHIPGAINVPWTNNTTQNKWKSPEDLKRIHKELEGKKEIIVYCGSGVTACANLLGMDEAGIENVKLYPGSWSDWITYPENPIEKEK